MQIFSPSPIFCSSKTKKKSLSAGFTLIELLISSAIIAIITTIVLVKYKAFDSTVLLKSTAYDIALSLRETQVRSVSVVRNSTSFDYPYGVTFDVIGPPQQKVYTVFRYKDAILYPVYDGPLVEDIQKFTLGGTMQVSAICITVATTETCSSDSGTPIDRLDVSFRRPEFNAIFYANGYSGTQSNIESAKIKVNSTSGASEVFMVTVSKYGQITVSKE